MMEFKKMMTLAFQEIPLVHNIGAGPYPIGPTNSKQDRRRVEQYLPGIISSLYPQQARLSRNRISEMWRMNISLFPPSLICQSAHLSANLTCWHSDKKPPNAANQPLATCWQCRSRDRTSDATAQSSTAKQPCPAGLERDGACRGGRRMIAHALDSACSGGV